MDEIANPIDYTPEQVNFFANVPDVLPLAQFRDGKILVADNLNPYKPLFILLKDGLVREVYNYFNLTKGG